MREDSLNDKDLYCIARHVNQYVEDSKAGREADAVQPCVSCKHAMNSTCPCDPWPSFIKLRKLTGVNITPFDPNLHQNFRKEVE